MDARRFDQFSRGLASVASRRTTLGGVAVAAIAALLPGVAPEGEAKKKKCKQGKKCAGRVCGNFGCKGRSCGECPLCQTCNAQGQCEPCAPENSCRTAICTPAGQCIRGNRFVGTSCGEQGEKCRDGQCVLPPTCTMGGNPCANGGQCCSGNCLPEILTCVPSGEGKPCLTDVDCFDPLKCPAFVCVPA